MKKYALVSVYDKSGLLDFARGLVELGIGLLSTGGTAKFLEESGFEVTKVEDYTGHPEILDGRVKTLHPKVHGGLLARRHLESDLEQLKTNDISLIDFVVVNLYPFTQKVSEVEGKKDPEHSSLIEDIDIGGPTMLRAAAKNYKDVVVVSDPSDYDSIISDLKSNSEVSLERRRKLAMKVFATMSKYDGAIARYFSLEEKLLNQDGSRKQFAPIEAMVLEKNQELRYGENPHQEASLYREYGVFSDKKSLWKQLQGKELSYNNIADMHAAIELAVELKLGLSQEKSFAVVIKHCNPCGVAIRANTNEAFEAAKACDPLSAFGGIISIGGQIDKDTASAILEQFVEVVICEDFTKEALEVFKTKKNVRLIQANFSDLGDELKNGEIRVKNSFGDFLLQNADNALFELRSAKVVTKAKPTEQMLADFHVAWMLVKHVKSNTIVVVKDGQAVGIGAGQMSRVDAAKLAVERARLHGHSLDGAVAASDAFLPFPDTFEILVEAGIKGLVQPGGSIKDEDVVYFADSQNAVMLITGERHFRH